MRVIFCSVSMYLFFYQLFVPNQSIFAMEQYDKQDLLVVSLAGSLMQCAISTSPHVPPNSPEPDYCDNNSDMSLMGKDNFFLCAYCSLKFDSHKKLENHMFSGHQVVLCVCNKVFPKYEDFWEHYERCPFAV